jgi:SAM-dependent methyltransferase
MTKSVSADHIDHYGAQYGNIDRKLLAEIREEAFGEDIGQTGWLTANEQDTFIEWLELEADSHLLDIACGSGRPTLRIAKKTGCFVTGIDIHEEAIAGARKHAGELELSARAEFESLDAAKALPFKDNKFDAVLCVDAINHLPERQNVLAEWRRVLKPGGLLVFTDPIVVTGQLTNQEIAVRASIGLFLFVPRGADETFLEHAGFEILRVEDRTENMARNARGWLNARAKREADLHRIEGAETFAGQQVFFEMAARLAEERRLSRFAILARNPR